MQSSQISVSSLALDLRNTVVGTQSAPIPITAPGVSDYINLSKSGNTRGIGKPSNAPTGTKPINNKSLKLPHEQIEEIKEGAGARLNDWTGIAPKGDVITGTPNGKAINHGPADRFTNRPTGLVR